MTRFGSFMGRRWRAGRIALRHRIREARHTAAAAGRKSAWPLAAVTGTIGIVLLLLMQLSATVSPRLSGDTHAVTPDAAALPRHLPSAADEIPAESATSAEPAPTWLIDGEHPELPQTGEGLPHAAEEAAPTEGRPPRVGFDIVVGRYADSDERFDVASAQRDAFDFAQLTGASSPGEPWDRFDRQRALAALQSSADLLALAPGYGAVEPRPIEPLELEEAPEGQARFNVSIEKRVPERGVVSQPLDYEIVVRNQGDDEVPQINIDELIPDAHRVRQTTPAARIDGQTLSWQLREIAPGEERRLHVKVVPQSPGTADAASVVEAMAAVTATTRVAAPRVRLEVLTPGHNAVGRLTTLTYRVTNAGEVEAGDIVLRTDLPAMLEHPLGRELDHPLGTLAPGETRELTLTALAASTGSGTHWSDVISSGHSLDVWEHDLSVGPPALSLRREGLKELRVGEAVEFINHIANTGGRDLPGLEIIETVPDGFDVVNVGDGGQFDRDTRTIRWQLDPLPAGQRVTRGVTLRPFQPGELRTLVMAHGAAFGDERMQASVTARPAVAAAPAARGGWPRGPISAPWGRSMPAFGWSYGMGLRSGCAP